MKKNKLRHFLLLFVAAPILLVAYANCGSGFTPLSLNEEGRIKQVAGEDPLFSYAWHLLNVGQIVFAQEAGTTGNDLNLQEAWRDQFFGQGIQIRISDDGIEDSHEDLHNNYNYSNQSRNYLLPYPYVSRDAPPSGEGDNHGTSVAGLAAALGWNSLGSRGVASQASIACANFLSDSVTQTSAKQVDQASGDFDISSMSWGVSQNSISSPDSNYEAQLRYAITNKRNGRGANFVKAAGNDFVVLCNNSSSAYCIGNSNFDADNTNPYTILVAALNAQGTSASYSSPGANLWISSLGGEFGDDSPALLTTDRMGCEKGYAASDADSTIDFEKGGSENESCNYTATFNGTSGATPLITGSVALLLQANPNLSWRDIKYILAKTATVVNPGSGTINHPINALPAGYIWEQRWITNAAGFKFHNWYGFGRANVDAAMNLAKNYNVNLGAYTSSNWINNIAGLNLAIPDNSATGVSSTMNVVSHIRLESVQLQVWITHADISELALELTSPSGTKSIVVNMRNSLSGIANYEGEVLLTNAFYQENSFGNWTLKVVDGKAAKTGSLTRWSLNFTGAQ